ncbi:MAG: substrate-binding domain-containing protein [Melioribacteraceae bacterium]|nr:substrate-binding domain-containing protein [Melioribacteraceae bacterium]
MNSLLKTFSLFIILTLLVVSCQEAPKETATRGKVKCLVDESLFTMISAIKDTFSLKYPAAKIELEKVKAKEGMVKMLNGEETMFISSRGLTEDESNFFEKTKSSVKVIKFCYDALTVVVDSSHKLNRITTTELKQLLLGNSKQYRIYIPDQNSGIFDNLKIDLTDKQNPKGAYIVKNEEEVVEKVRKDKNSIGIVGLNIANQSKLKILRIGTDERSATGGVYYEPAAGYLSNGEYPLIRTCYILLNEIGVYVGSGFTSYITSTEGQKIVLSYGLGPATVPIKYKQIVRMR